jgi:hypothetical protein
VQEACCTAQEENQMDLYSSSAEYLKT